MGFSASSSLVALYVLKRKGPYQRACDELCYYWVWITINFDITMIFTVYRLTLLRNCYSSYKAMIKQQLLRDLESYCTNVRSLRYLRAVGQAPVARMIQQLQNPPMLRPASRNDWRVLRNSWASCGRRKRILNLPVWYKLRHIEPACAQSSSIIFKKLFERSNFKKHLIG